ncbi:hypothetical protein [Streptomyces sp. NBC_01373]|uniref:hypothetical protein n=1 Tax=Streptomyces sp. NBC_01373 TaxID=2903843 RepID=UPI002254F8B8|nr:hypothetical protein [Streptomyces sp. NBC_01373]MCX4707177.1 hypothetical protein [Streptomyces sp. NBC_01373]
MARKKVRRCSQCAIPLPDGSRQSRRYCSPACRMKAWRWRQEREEWWDSNADFIAALREGLPYHRPKVRCPVCKGWWYVGEAPSWLRKRVDAVYCSPRCRTRAYRERRSRSEGVTG